MDLMDLVRRAAEGDELAFARLEREFTPMMLGIARSHFGPSLVEDDLMQEARFGLFKAVRDFRAGTAGDEGRASGFPNFANICITRQVITAVKAALRNKHGPLNEAVSYDAPGRDGGPSLDLPVLRADPEARLLDREQLERLLHALRWDLTKIEAQSVWGIEAEGLSYEAVAEAIGVSEKAVDNAAQRGRRKLAEVFADATCEMCGAALDWGKLCDPCAEEVEFARQFLAA